MVGCAIAVQNSGRGVGEPSFPGNRLFTSLAPATRERLRPYTHSVHLAKGRRLYDLGSPISYVFFPLNGMIALFATTETADDISVALVGADGVVGVPPIVPAHGSPYAAAVEVPSEAYRVHAEAIWREFGRGEDLRAVMLASVDGLVRELVQAAVCHSAHALPHRVCRWLLMIRDCVHADTIDLTQEAIAHMLGATRPKVSVALASLEDQQLIRQWHGRLRILNPRGLALCSCECYRVLRDEAHGVLHTPTPAHHHPV